VTKLEFIGYNRVKITRVSVHDYNSCFNTRPRPPIYYSRPTKHCALHWCRAIKTATRIKSITRYDRVSCDTVTLPQFAIFNSTAKQISRLTIGKLLLVDVCLSMKACIHGAQV